MIASRWPVAQMIREVSEIVFSERKFEELLATATNTGEAHQGSKHQPYRRALLQGKQARPEFMLPKARNIVRMVLTTRADEKVLSHAGVVERPPVMVEDISRTPELRASIESSLGLAEGSSSFDLSRETFQFLGAFVPRGRRMEGLRAREPTHSTFWERPLLGLTLLGLFYLQ